jgi:hypothetical protein
MNNKHWQILGLLLGGLAMQLAGVHHWAEVTSPAFVGGTLAMASAALRALYTDKPEKSGTSNGD